MRRLTKRRSSLIKTENRAGRTGGDGKIVRCDGHAAGIKSVLIKIGDQRKDISGDAGNKVQNQHPHVAEHGFAGTAEQIEREHIRSNVCEAEMQKHGGEKTPPLSENNSGSIHCAKTVGDGGTLRPACRGLDEEHDSIDEDEYVSDEYVSDLIFSKTALTVQFCGSHVY